MARAAVTVDSPNPGASARPPRSFRLRRIHLALIALAVVAIWLVFVFAKALSDVDHATAVHQSIAAETQALQARLDAVHKEQQIVQSDAFQRMQARSYGMGATGEIVFALPPNAPSPAPIAPLGVAAAKTASGDTATPLDAWLRILFGN
jgi:cell division protein FtsB